MKNDRRSSNLKKVGRTAMFTCVALALLLAACQPKPTETPVAPPVEPAPTMAPEEPAPSVEVPPEMLGVEWVLIGYGDALNPVVVEPGTRPTAVFSADGNLSGSGGCNNFSSVFQIQKDGISFGPAAITAMACEKGMEQEGTYLAALDKAISYQIERQDRLLINYDSGAGYPEQLVFQAETPLVGTTWVLTAYGDLNNPTPSQAGVLSTAIFSADGTLNGSGGCNNFSATYTTQGGQISIGMPASNIMECETGMEQELAYLPALQMAESYRIAGSYLEITYASGAQVLRFTARHLPLENVRWVLSAINGQPLPAGVAAYFVFTPGKDGQENQVNGNAGCNGFFGTYSVDGNTLSAPGPFGATQMICPDEAMQVEQAFLAGLQEVQSYQTILNQLTITTSTGTMVFYADRAPLEGPIWKLVSMGSIDNPRQPVLGTDFSASFARQQGMPTGLISGATGCNDYTTAYFANAQELKVNLPAKTQNTCSAAQAEDEQAYFLGLNEARDYRILGNELRIAHDGFALNFIATYPEGAVGPLAPLNGTVWWLVSSDNFVVIPGSEVTAQFTINPDGSTGQISGLAGCNFYNAAIQGVFQVGSPTAQLLICDTPAGIMDQEYAYLAALGAVQDISLQGDKLVINTGLGTLVYSSSGPSAVEPIQPIEPTVEPEQPIEPTPGPEQPLPTPVAVINAPTTGQVAQAITFDGSGSSSNAEITTYSWTFGDGVTAEGAVIEHSYAAPGNYDVFLTVTDANGQSADASIVLTIQ